MAKGDTATATIETPSDTPADGVAGTEPAKAKRQNRNTATMPLTMPKEMRALIDAKAKEENTTGAGIAKRLLANYVNYTLPLVVRAAKRTFASKEDRVKFQKDRNQKAKALLAALDSGEISPEILAKFIAAQNGSAVVTATADGNVEVAAGEGVPA